MDVALGIAALLALVALVTTLRERALRRRLIPVEARLVDPGRTGGPLETQMEADLRGDFNDSTMPTLRDSGYTARWTYEVKGRRYSGEHTQSKPVFAPAQIRFGRVQVFYDPANPAVSRPHPRAGENGWAWWIVAGVAAAVAAVIGVISAA